MLVLIGTGLSNGEIAAELFVGEATVKTHVSNVLAKLHLRDRVQAVVRAHQLGLIRPAVDGGSPPRGLIPPPAGVPSVEACSKPED